MVRFRARLSHPENLGDLCRAVKEHQADVGFAQDMDADRLASSRTKGSNRRRQHARARDALRTQSREGSGGRKSIHDFRGRGRCETFDCPVFLTKIGEVNVTDAMQQHDAVIGGEGNGGVIYPASTRARQSGGIALGASPARRVRQVRH